MSKDETQSGQEKHLGFVGGNNVETRDDDYESAIVKLRCPICHESFPSLTDAVKHILVDEKIAETNHEVISLMHKQMRLMRCNLCHDNLYSELGMVTSHFAVTHHLDIEGVKADPKM